MSFSIRISETVTMQSIVSLQDDLRAGLASNADVILDCAALTDADLSFVQLVEAARVQARRDGKTLTLSRPANPSLAALLARSGFLDRPRPHDIDFWFHGELPQ